MYDHVAARAGNLTFDPYGSDQMPDHYYSYDYLPDPGRKFPQVSTAAKAVLGLSYTLMIPVCGIGNLLLCCVIYRVRRMRTTTNLLIGNLALSDFIVAAVVAPFNFFYYIHQTWPFGHAMCVTVGYLKATSFYVSINSLLAIAIDRWAFLYAGADPGFSWGGGGGGRKRLCAEHAHYERGTELHFGRGPGPA